MHKPNIRDEVKTCDKIFSNETVVCILTKTAHQVYYIILILCQVLLHPDKVEDRKTRWRSSSDDGLVYIEAAEGLCGHNILSNFSICYTVPTLNLVNMHRNLTVVCLVLGRTFLINLLLSDTWSRAKSSMICAALEWVLYTMEHYHISWAWDDVYSLRLTVGVVHQALLTKCHHKVL